MSGYSQPTIRELQKFWESQALTEIYLQSGKVFMQIEMIVYFTDTGTSNSGAQQIESAIIMTNSFGW